MDSYIGNMDGWILIVLLIIFLTYSLITVKEKNNDTNTDPVKSSLFTIFKNILFIIFGIVMLAYGANFVVKPAIIMAQTIGLSQIFIGISVVAFGTSLPELATSAVAAARDESDISVGNVVGSNLFNICLVMGVVGIFNPMTLEKNIHYFQFPFMIFICFLLWFIAFINQGIRKKTGFLFIDKLVKNTNCIFDLCNYLKLLSLNFENGLKSDFLRVYHLLSYFFYIYLFLMLLLKELV